MRMKHYVLVFTEGVYVDTASYDTHEAADAYCDGLIDGANHYGAGDVSAYVMPQGEESMVEDQPADEVALARAALEKKRIKDGELPTADR